MELQHVFCDVGSEVLHIIYTYFTLHSIDANK